MIEVHEDSIRTLVKSYNHAKESYKLLHTILTRMGVINEIIKVPKTNTVLLVPPEFIIKHVEMVFNCDVKSVRQTNEIVRGRHAAAFFLKRYTTLSLSKIVVFIGRKDHTSVLNSCKTCQKWIETDEEYKKKMDGIESEILSYIERRSKH